MTRTNEPNEPNELQTLISIIIMYELLTKTERFPAWGIEQLTGYKPITTFWEDFCRAERMGPGGIIETVRIAFNEWHDNTECVTELAMVLNHKIAFWYDVATDETRPEQLRDAAMTICEIYDASWRAVDEWCCDHLTGRDLEYYFKITD